MDSWLRWLQRAWGDDPNPRVLVYDTNTSEWVGDYFYPLDEVESQNGGWVGLSDITPLGNDRFLVLERDNQGGPDAAIKRLYTIKLSPNLEDGTTLQKTFVRDLIPDFAESGGLTPEKLEGLAITDDGVWVINDNDGVDDNSGETQLLNLDSSVFRQRLRGTNNSDRLIGSVGDDRLVGRDGNDRLIGLTGDDTLIGGQGVDRHFGGAGNDTFVFKRRELLDPPDKILDFEVGSDVIDLTRVFRGDRFESADPFADFVRIKGSSTRTQVQIDLNGNNSGENFQTLVVLRGVDVDTIDSASFYRLSMTFLKLMLA